MDSHGKLAISSFLRQYFLVILFGLLGILFIGIGLINSQEKEVEPLVFESEEKGEIVVDVNGAVIKPGVYKLQSDARIHDAVIAAGGMSAEADREYVAQNMNMAEELSDGQKVYIRFEGEEEDITVITEENSGNLNLSTSGLININTASQSQLDSLPGVGPVTIEKIVDGRPYSNVEELLSKDVLGSSTYEKVKSLVSVN